MSAFHVDFCSGDIYFEAYITVQKLIIFFKMNACKVARRHWGGMYCNQEKVFFGFLKYYWISIIEYKLSSQISYTGCYYLKSMAPYVVQFCSFTSLSCGSCCIAYLMRCVNILWTKNYVYNLYSHMHVLWFRPLGQLNWVDFTFLQCWVMLSAYVSTSIITLACCLAWSAHSIGWFYQVVYSSNIRCTFASII